MEAAFLSIPLRSGYPLQAWRKGVDCTLVKKVNSYRVDKLRTIVLFEAEFNFINKAASRKLAYAAKKKKMPCNRTTWKSKKPQVDRTRTQQTPLHGYTLPNKATWDNHTDQSQELLQSDMPQHGFPKHAKNWTG